MFTLYYWVFIIVCMYCLYTSLKNEKKKKEKHRHTHRHRHKGAPVPNHMNLGPVLTIESASEHPWAQRLGSEGGSQWPLHPLQAQDIRLKEQMFQGPPCMLSWALAVVVAL